MAALFKKRKKTMSERPNVSPEASERDQTTDPQGNPLGPASEAASGHRTDDSDKAMGSESEMERLRAELDVQKTEHQALHDKYVRLFAEFDNFRKRTAKERMDLVQNAGADTLRSVLPVLDDLKRAMANNESADDLASVKEGFGLIDHKLRTILQAQGLQPMDSSGKPFDPDWHEAITKAPAPSDDLKGKVIDVLEDGYTLHGKVLRYAKVVVGE